MPLRIPQAVKAATVIGLVSGPIGALSLAAHAGQASTGPVSAMVARQHQWWLGALHITTAWRTDEGTGVTVAVLADGVVASQADLAGSVISGPDFTGSGRKAGGRYYGVVGTGLASLIAGHGHGRKNAQGAHTEGIYGVAGGARILSVRVTLSPGDPLWSRPTVTSRLPDAVARGIRYAVARGATVIALPADPGVPGSSALGWAAAASGGSPAELAAVDYARSKNVVLVAPAGDNGLGDNTVSYPAVYPGVIVVGAFGQNFVKAPYSSHQQYVTLTAAGQGVVAASPAGYQMMNSTWAASAIAAGVAALVRSEFPNLTASQVSAVLSRSTVYRPRNAMVSGSGHGTIDAAKALLMAATMSPPQARLASNGALPRIHPLMPATASQRSILGRDLIRDGVLSASALAGLLVPITLYGSAAKRRERRVTQAAAERERQSRVRAGQPTMLADPLLEFFGPQHSRPADRAAGQRTPVGSRYAPRPGLTGRSTLSSAQVARPTVSVPPPTSPAVLAAPTGAPARPIRIPPKMAPPIMARPSTAPPAGRPETSPTVLHAPVAGAPPWEPAPRPTTDLPWALVPTPHSGHARPTGFGTSPTQGGPPESVWDAVPARLAPEPAPASPFDPVPPPAHAGQDQAEPARGDTGGRPIYVWNPTATTDPFPAFEDGAPG